jgi:type III restriction enzyme
VSESLSRPILNRPYEQPDRYFEIGPQGPTGEVKSGRRPSESYIPIAPAKKGKGALPAEQTEIDFDLTGERREKNSLINDLRREVGTWRQQGDDR